jgi:lysophospholipase L1-like esterase
MASKEQQKVTTKRKLLVVGIAGLLVLAGLGGLFLQYFGNRNTSAATVIRVACIGDSITEVSGYPADLQTILGKDYLVFNFGVSGSGVLLKSDIPYMNEALFWRALEFEPDIVVVMLGTNDANNKYHRYLQDFSVDYEKLIRQIQTLASKPQIYLVSPPPILNNSLDFNNTSLQQDIIPCIQQKASQLNLPIINVNACLASHPECFTDGVHPDSQGARLIAEEISRTLTTSYMG